MLRLVQAPTGHVRKTPLAVGQERNTLQARSRQQIIDAPQRILTRNLGMDRLPSIELEVLTTDRDRLRALADQVAFHATLRRRERSVMHILLDVEVRAELAV